MSEIKKVLANVVQSLTAAEKQQARTNIGAAGNGFVEVSTSSTFAQVKAIVDAGDIPYLTTTSNGYKTFYWLYLDGKAGSSLKYFQFVHVQDDRVIEKDLKNDDTWSTSTTYVQKELTAGTFMNIAADGTISVKKTEQTDFWAADDQTTRVVAFEDNPQNPRRNYRSIMNIPAPSAGVYRVDFNVVLRVGNLPQVSLDNRTLRIIICNGDRTDAVQIGGTHGIVFNLPAGATTGTIVSVSGSIIAKCTTANTFTLNIFNDSGTGSMDESYYIDYSCVFSEKITDLPQS